ncbi:unnamed protein product, partial [Ectocarpus sp. 12 AP-2014]
MVLVSSLKLMGLAGLLTAATFIPPATALDEPTCSTGLQGIDGDNESGSVCCTAGCGQCGGQGCGSVEDYDNTNCCIDDVL